MEQYGAFVNTTRKYKSDKNALEKSMKECIKNGILQDYLQRKGGEVINMLMAEYDYEMDMRVQREEAYEEAYEKAAEEAREAVEKAQQETQKAKEETKQAKEETQKAREEIKKSREETQKTKEETAKRMIKMEQFTPAVIAQISGLTEAEVVRISRTLK